METLFDGQLETYELFDAQRLRVILKRESTAEEADQSNRHFIKSLCPHLQFRRASESSGRVYKIRNES
jgi:hypothetical protein